ncbi:hypothetical protein VPH35_123021 [Triticum aestivum]
MRSSTSSSGPGRGAEGWRRGGDGEGSHGGWDTGSWICRHSHHYSLIGVLILVLVKYSYHIFVNRYIVYLSILLISYKSTHFLDNFLVLQGFISPTISFSRALFFLMMSVTVDFHFRSEHLTFSFCKTTTTTTTTSDLRTLGLPALYFFLLLLQQISCSCRHLFPFFL